jgi:hypothetical protein
LCARNIYDYTFLISEEQVKNHVIDIGLVLAFNADEHLRLLFIKFPLVLDARDCIILMKTFFEKLHHNARMIGQMDHEVILVSFEYHAFLFGLFQPREVCIGA